MATPVRYKVGTHAQKYKAIEAILQHSPELSDIFDGKEPDISTVEMVLRHTSDTVFAKIAPKGAEPLKPEEMTNEQMAERVAGLRAALTDQHLAKLLATARVAYKMQNDSDNTISMTPKYLNQAKRENEEQARMPNVQDGPFAPAPAPVADAPAGQPVAATEPAEPRMPHVGSYKGLGSVPSIPATQKFDSAPEVPFVPIETEQPQANNRPSVLKRALGFFSSLTPSGNMWLNRRHNEARRAKEKPVTTFTRLTAGVATSIALAVGLVSAVVMNSDQKAAAHDLAQAWLTGQERTETRTASPLFTAPEGARGGQVGFRPGIGVTGPVGVLHAMPAAPSVDTAAEPIHIVVDGPDLGAATRGFGRMAAVATDALPQMPDANAVASGAQSIYGAFTAAVTDAAKAARAEMERREDVAMAQAVTPEGGTPQTTGALTAAEGDPVMRAFAEKWGDVIDVDAPAGTVQLPANYAFSERVEALSISVDQAMIASTVQAETVTIDRAAIASAVEPETVVLSVQQGEVDPAPAPAPAAPTLASLAQGALDLAQENDRLKDLFNAVQANRTRYAQDALYNMARGLTSVGGEAAFTQAVEIYEHLSNEGHAGVRTLAKDALDANEWLPAQFGLTPAEGQAIIAQVKEGKAPTVSLASAPLTLHR